MSTTADAWLSLFLLLLFGSLYLLRLKFPDASKRSETATLVIATVLFFSICNFFISPRNSSAATQGFVQTKASLTQR